MADKTTKIIEIEVELEGGEKVTKQFEQLADGTQKAVDSAEKLDAKFEDVYRNIEPLTTRMGEAEDRLYELALAGDTTSKEYQELLASVGNYRKVQIQTDLAVDQAANTFSQKLGGAITGATSGFAAVQGAMALVGTESEALEQTLLKVQGALALQQGVQGVLEYSKSIGLASKATKAFNAIVRLNPLALLVTTLVAIIGYFAVFTDAIDVAIQGLKDLTDWIGITGFAEEKRAKKQAEIATRQAEYRKAEIEYLKAQGKNTAELEKQILREALAIAEREKQRNIAFGFKQGEIEADTKILELKGQIAAIDKAEAEKQKQYAADRLNATRQIQDAQVELLEEGSKKEIVENKLKFDRLREDTLKATNLTRKEKQKLIDLYDKQEMDSHNKIVDNFIAELERQQTETKNRIDAFNNSFQDEIEALAEENYQRFLTEQEREELAVQDKYFRLETLAEGNAEALAEIELAKANELNDIQLKYGQEAQDQQDALDAKAIEAAKIVADTKNSIREAELANIEAGINLAKSLFGDNKKLQAAALIAENAVGIAKTIINTQAANAAAVAQGTALAIPTAGASVAAASAAVLQNNISAGISIAASIAATAQGLSALGTGGDTGGGDLPAGGGGGAQTPNFNVVGDSGVNQLAELQQQPTQAYVVSGEVTTAQALDRNRVQNATL